MRVENQRRLILYLTFSFLPVWIPTLIYTAGGGAYESQTMYAILTYSMLCPAVGMVLTRLITREGFPMRGKGSLGLRISFRKGKWRYYLAAILLPTIYLEAGYGLFYLLFPESFQPTLLQETGIPKNALWLYPLATCINTCALSVGALGEEAGWRGYMMPKLEELFGIRKAVLIGGLIWGIWHYPAIAAGHGYGTGYRGAPWTGFLVFTLATVAYGAVMTLLTKKSGSIWPTVFLHAVNNGGGSILGLCFDGEKLTGLAAQAPVAGLIQELPLLLIGGIAAVWLCRENQRGTPPVSQEATSMLRS